MAWKLLGEPKPRERVIPYQTLAWPDGERCSLSRPVDALQSFCDVTASRRSKRSFGPLALADLSALLWYASRTIAAQSSSLGFDISLRPVPSAGAIHPIHLLVCSALNPVWQRYEPSEHSLVTVTEGLVPPCEALAQAAPAVDPQGGTLLWLAAEVGKTAAKYENAESLVWRDAGALLAQLAVTASYLGLHFCPLGLVGHAWAEGLDQTKLICGVGTALVGAPFGSNVIGHDV